MEQKPKKYWYGINDENYDSGPYDSIDECIASARADKEAIIEDTDGGGFVYIGVETRKFKVRPDWIRDCIESWYYDFLPDCEVEFDKDFDEQLEKLIKEKVHFSSEVALIEIGQYDVINDKLMMDD
jgi:hypothetical protein